MSYWKLGCRWGSKTQGKPLFYDLLVKYNIVIGWEDKDYGINANILLTDGHTSLGVAKTIGPRKSVLSFPEFEEEFDALEIDYSKHLYVYDAFILTLNKDQRFSFETQVGICRINQPYIQNKINQIISINKQSFMDRVQKNSYINLLEYKKQIILQGPPGTGKTKLAKEIAISVINEKLITDIDWIKFTQGFKEGDRKKMSNGIIYTIKEVKNKSILLSVSTSSDMEISEQDIVYNYNQQTWKDTSEDEAPVIWLAKMLDNKYNHNKLDDSPQIKLVQFHPSYTYEDFVRGISAEPNAIGNGVLFTAKDKVLGKFAKEALNNYLDSKKSIGEVSKETWTKDRISEFQKYLEDKLDKEEQIWLTPNVAYVTRITDENIRYKGDNWKLDGGIPYSDLEKMFLARVSTLTDIRQLNTLTLSAKSNSTYWLKTLELFKSYLDKRGLKLPENETGNRIKLKKYVLIIDEINRANLSSVLGELIYALEYRDEKFDSMYSIGGESDDERGKKMVLPSNLYIIGTMNTADRSVGHIDYAIRRRFAFVDILPKELNDDKIVFHHEWFRKISELFIENYDEYKVNEKTTLKPAKTLSSEFRPEDVWLGHSYFIQKKVEGSDKLEPEDFRIRIDYEIKPILLEYVKDGVLVGEINTKKIEDYIKSL